MNDDSPQNELMVSINMPESIWTFHPVLPSLTLLSDGLPEVTKRVDTVEGGNNPPSLNLQVLLSKKAHNVADASTWMLLLVVENEAVQLFVGKIREASLDTIGIKVIAKSLMGYLHFFSKQGLSYTPSWMEGISEKGFINNFVRSSSSSFWRSDPDWINDLNAFVAFLSTRRYHSKNSALKHNKNYQHILDLIFQGEKLRKEGTKATYTLLKPGAQHLMSFSKRWKCIIYICHKRECRVCDGVEIVPNTMHIEI